MPIIAYSCSENHVIKKFYRLVSKAPAFLICNICKKKMNRLLSPPSSRSIIVIDNGIQSRKVEVDLNVIEANQERANKDYSKE